MRGISLIAAGIYYLHIATAQAAPPSRGSDIHYTRGQSIELARASNISSVDCHPTKLPTYQLSEIPSGKLRIEKEVRVLRDGEGPFHDANVGRCEGSEVTEYVLYYDPAPGFFGQVPVNYTVNFGDGSSSRVNDVVIVEKRPEPATRCPSQEELRAKEKKIVAKSRRTKAVWIQCREVEI